MKYKSKVLTNHKTYELTEESDLNLEEYQEEYIAQVYTSAWLQVGNSFIPVDKIMEITISDCVVIEHKFDVDWETLNRLSESGALKKLAEAEEKVILPDAGSGTTMVKGGGGDGEREWDFNKKYKRIGG